MLGQKVLKVKNVVNLIGGKSHISAESVFDIDVFLHKVNSRNTSGRRRVAEITNNNNNNNNNNTHSMVQSPS